MADGNDINEIDDEIDSNPSKSPSSEGATGLATNSTNGPYGPNESFGKKTLVTARELTVANFFVLLFLSARW